LLERFNYYVCVWLWISAASVKFWCDVRLLPELVWISHSFFLTFFHFVRWPVVMVPSSDGKVRNGWWADDVSSEKPSLANVKDVSKLTDRQQTVLELLQTESNYVTIINTILKVCHLLFLPPVIYRLNIWDKVLVLHIV